MWQAVQVMGVGWKLFRSMKSLYGESARLHECESRRVHLVRDVVCISGSSSA